MVTQKNVDVDLLVYSCGELKKCVEGCLFICLPIYPIVGLNKDKNFLKMESYKKPKPFLFLAKILF